MAGFANSLLYEGNRENGGVRQQPPSGLGLPPKIEDVKKVGLWFKLEAIMKKSKFTEEQIVRILQEAASGQKTQA